MRRHQIARLAIAALLASQIVPPAIARGFSLQVGPPVAGNAQPAKSSLLVVRPLGCADPASAQISATAEGIVDGTRRRVPLKLLALPTRGVHAVAKEWPREGVWIVSLVGSCGGETAGAIVSFASPSAEYHRDAVKYLAHPATPLEIEASLKVLTMAAAK